jgi:hypothetical protein
MTCFVRKLLEARHVWAGLVLLASALSSAENLPNDQPAYDFFVAHGLPGSQAAGVVGNLDEESGVDPAAVEPGGPGRGIAQWSAGGRWDTTPADNVQEYAASQGQPADSLNLQLGFIWYELTTFPQYGLTQLRESTNVSDAAVAFETFYEICGMCIQSTRIAYAESVWAAYGSSDADAGPVHPPRAMSGGCSAGSGEASSFGLSLLCLAFARRISPRQGRSQS